VQQQARAAERCRELARGHTLLPNFPERALAIASALLREAPEFAAARLLRGRALARSGNSAAALNDLAPVLEHQTAPLHPLLLLDGGRAAIAENQLPLAARFYQALGSQASLLPDRAAQVVALLELSSVLIATQRTPSDEVLGYLREARRHAPGSGMQGLAMALTALAWTSKGSDAEAQAALLELTDPWGLSRFESARDAARLTAELVPAPLSAQAGPESGAEPARAFARSPVVLPDGVLHALSGFALERRDAALAAAHYRAFRKSALANGVLSPWLEARLRSLSGKAAR
jgi:tetratricopeptide (TPR) repeat protein